MWEDALADQRCLRHEWGSGRVGESGRIVKMVCVCVRGGGSDFSLWKPIYSVVLNMLIWGEVVRGQKLVLESWSQVWVLQLEH